MNLQQMRYFVMVARLGNVTEAAKALHIAQPPLSRQIKQLEQELGVVLFDRSGRRLHLTETGHMLLHRAEEILNLTDRTVCELSSSELGQEGILSLGVVPSMSLMVLPQMIAAFKELYPKITYRLLIGESLRVIELLEKINDRDPEIVFDTAEGIKAMREREETVLYSHNGARKRPAF